MLLSEQIFCHLVFGKVAQKEEGDACQRVVVIPLEYDAYRVIDEFPTTWRSKEKM